MVKERIKVVKISIMSPMNNSKASITNLDRVWSPHQKKTNPKKMNNNQYKKVLSKKMKPNNTQTCKHGNVKTMFPKIAKCL